MMQESYRINSEDEGWIRELNDIFGDMKALKNGDGNLTRLAEALDPAEAPSIYAACGTDDFLFEANEAFIALYGTKFNIRYTTKQGAAHTWDYWDEQIGEVLRWLPLGENGGRLVSKKVKAMDRLLSEGFFTSREEALPYLMSGAVTCGGVPVRTGGQAIPVELSLAVRGLGERYVGKGGYKLEGALNDFQLSAEGRICIDAGACTGGFTDCLVQHGAARVYAVEVGFGQLAGSLAQNPSVVNLERTNLGDEKLLSLEPPPTLGSVDLSYLSLEKAVPQFRAIMRGQGELICLVKPLFETESSDARRTGELGDDAYLPLLSRLIESLNAQAGTRVLNVAHSHITGNNGTREFFLHVAFGEGERPNLAQVASEAVEKALALGRYRKER